MKFAIGLVFLSILFISCRNDKEKHGELDVKKIKHRTEESVNTHGLGHNKLSEYGFFKQENLADLIPSANVFPYTINAPLFSDYSFKERFIYFPSGQKAEYSDTSVFFFPEGTIVIKNFYFPYDFRNENERRRIIETRLLIKEKEDWRPLSYIWNEDQTEAYFEILGDEVDISWVHYDGNDKSVRYKIPDLNQCKNCHMHEKNTELIGTSARQMNVFLKSDNINQLRKMELAGFIDLPKEGSIPYMHPYDIDSVELGYRARSYLDINCGSCHNSKGSAKTSGLFLDIYEEDLYKLGVFKGPVAAGKASGNRLFSIVPGKPNESIITFRMESVEPEIMMPELGRSLVHEEGVLLIRKWIENWHETN